MQAKSNASKYTGVSSEDVRSGGFGAKTSSYNSTSSSTFGMTRKYSGGLGGSSGLGSTGFGSGSRGSGYTDYDEPLDSVSLLSAHGGFCRWWRKSDGSTMLQR